MEMKYETIYNKTHKQLKYGKKITVLLIRTHAPYSPPPRLTAVLRSCKRFESQRHIYMNSDTNCYKCCFIYDTLSFVASNITTFNTSLHWSIHKINTW